MQTQLQKQKESTITTATVQQKSIENTGFTLQDNRATPNAITQLQEVTQLGDKKRFKKGKKSKTKKTFIVLLATFGLILESKKNKNTRKNTKNAKQM